MTDLREIFSSCYPITGADLSVQHYILHFNNAKKRLKNGGNKYVLDLLSAITAENIEVDKNERVVFKTGEGGGEEKTI